MANAEWCVKFWVNMFVSTNGMELCKKDLLNIN